jgi:putative spermidine/putrescine transport system ATP-binding protein
MLDALGAIRVDVDAWRRVGKGAVDVLVRPERVQLAAPGADPALSNQLALEIGVIVNYGDSVLVIGSAGGRRLRMRVAGAPPDAVREGATVIVGWKPGDEHLITP